MLGVTWGHDAGKKSYNFAVTSNGRSGLAKSEATVRSGSSICVMAERSHAFLIFDLHGATVCLGVVSRAPSRQQRGLSSGPTTC
jgi:hypothetical protein